MDLREMIYFQGQISIQLIKLEVKIFLITRYKRYLQSSDEKLEESIIKLLSRYRIQEKYF